jgi:hypothetical protein
MSGDWIRLAKQFMWHLMDFVQTCDIEAYLALARTCHMDEQLESGVLK